MQIRDFLEKQGKKVIIADAVSVGNALIRRCNIEDGVYSIDTTVLTPLKIAEELVIAYESSAGSDQIPQILNADGAVYVFDEVLSEHCPGFIPEQCLTIATVAQIYQAVSVIRSFDKTEEYWNTDVPGIKDITGLIKAYEERLEKDRLFDPPKVISRAIEILEGLKKGEGEFSLAFFLPWADGCKFADLCTNKRKGFEKDLIDRLMEVCDTELLTINVLPYGEIKESKASGKVDWEFFASYGQHNEVKYVAEKIMEAVSENGRSFDQINLFYTSADYENYVAGIFDHYKIPYVFDDCYHASNNNFVQLLFKILDFADHGYRFEDLEDIVLSKILTYNGIKDTQKINPNNGYIKTPGEKIGWGRERFEDYLCDADVMDEIKSAKEADMESVPDDRDVLDSLNRGYFAIFLKDILDIFDGTNSLSETYNKLLILARKYTYKGNKEENAERKEILEKLNDQKLIFGFVSEKRYSSDSGSISEKTSLMIKYIRDFLENLTYSRKTGPVAVGVHKLSGFKILERPVNYFIGMGAKQFALNSTESAVISDEEMKLYLSGPNIPYAGQRNINRQDRFRMMLESLPAGSITLGYSNFDSVGLKECAPSVMLMELQEDRDAGDVITYNPIDKEIKIDPEGYRLWIDRFMKKQKASMLVTPDSEAQMSASQLQVLLECPLKYYYKSIRKLSVQTIRTPYGDQWLPPMDRGNLIHRVCQHYLETVMPPVGELRSDLNESLFERIYDEEIKKIESEVPWASNVVKAKEISENKEALAIFLQRLHEEWVKDAEENGKNWWILGCELDFEYDDNIIYKDDGKPLEAEPDENYVATPYSIHFSKGQIDRLDGYVDSEGYLNLRIIDYKTGDFLRKKEEINNDIEIQHYVYAMATFDHVNKLRDHKVETKYNIFDTFSGIKGVRIEDVAYVFPFEYESKAILSVMNESSKEKKWNMKEYMTQDDDDPFKWKVEFSDGVRQKLRLTEGYRQNDMIDSIAGNIEDNMGVLWDVKCRFCDYKSICRTKCGIDKVNPSDDDQETEEGSAEK